MIDKNKKTGQRYQNIKQKLKKFPLVSIYIKPWPISPFKMILFLKPTKFIYHSIYKIVKKKNYIKNVGK